MLLSCASVVPLVGACNSPALQAYTIPCQSRVAAMAWSSKLKLSATRHPAAAYRQERGPPVVDAVASKLPSGLQAMASSGALCAAISHTAFPPSAIRSYIYKVGFCWGRGEGSGFIIHGSGFSADMDVWHRARPMQPVARHQVDSSREVPTNLKRANPGAASFRCQAHTAGQP